MQKLRVLLVENDPAKTHQLLSLLAGEGHSPVPVPDIAEATEAVFVQKFDLVLLSAEGSAESILSLADALRKLEASQSTESRALILSCSTEEDKLSCLDGYLPPDFTAVHLAETVSSSLARMQGSRILDSPDPALLPVFEQEQFQEQCAFDSELMVEIIDLFFAERDKQFADMRNLLEEADFEKLSRVAHTIKGSLASLHAPLARHRAQALETAANGKETALCAQILNDFELDSTTLNRHLSAFRDACLCR